MKKYCLLLRPTVIWEDPRGWFKTRQHNKDNMTSKNLLSNAVIDPCPSQIWFGERAAKEVQYKAHASLSHAEIIFRPPNHVHDWFWSDDDDGCRRQFRALLRKTLNLKNDYQSHVCGCNGRAGWSQRKVTPCHSGVARGGGSRGSCPP